MKSISTIIALAAVPAGLATAQTTHIAYQVPAGQAGNQEFNGALGMEFDVDNGVNVTKLGCFDDNSDGLILPISVRLYNRDTLEVVASLEFIPDDSGTPAREDGTLVGGSRFLALTTPVSLPTGFHGTIVAEGYGAGERNGNASGQPVTSWTQDNGNASLGFVGTSRFNFPVVAGAYPETPDDGPAARYAAGTFEFVTTAPETPGPPVVTAVPGNAKVDLSWPAVTAPLPAAKYRVLRGDAPGGPFTQIAEIPETSYADTGLTNDTLYCYVVRGVGGGGQVGPESLAACARPFDLGANRLIAYDTPWGVAGTQNFAGAVGMDFDVVNPVIVRQLGCFDDNSDGLFTTISVRLYNRDTQEIMASLVFDPDDAGTPEREDGQPLGGMRFKPLAAPLNLPSGFHGVIVAEGYNAMERLKNSFGNLANVVWTTRDGNGSLAFVGTSRYNFPIVPEAFPETPVGGPAARYAGGTFIYETTPPSVPGTPVIRGTRENYAVTLVWDAVTQPLPAARYHVLRGDSLAGPFTQIGETTQTTYRDTPLPNGIEKCYLVRAIGAGGETGLDSNIVCVVPAARTGGIAYIVPPGTVGNQEFGGALGMEFDVDRPVIVTRLGVFDSGSDGLFLTISARLYNRDTQQVVGSLSFDPGDEGELVDGSRLKNLPAPLALPAGFHGMMVASGYGAGEPNGNAGFTDLGLTTFDGACLRFVGTSSYDVNPAGIATVADGGPANRYAAGTFAFEPDLQPAGLTITPATGGFRLDWTDLTGSLERSADLSLWELVPAATPGLVLPATQPRLFFRLTR